MKHIDEGTIHAWLDGALSEAEAKQVGDHAASCAQCGALVAEARGFIAGASRILTSLDDVPAGIAPKRTPAVASTKPAKRSWQAAPWVTGIAAALILAIGVKEWRERPSAKTAFLPVPANVVDSLRALESARVDQRTADSAVLRAVRPPELQPLRAPAAPTRPPLARERAEVASASGAAAGAGDLKKLVAEAPQTTAPVSAAAVAEFTRDSTSARDRVRQLAGCYRVESAPAPLAAAQGRAAATAERPQELRARMAPTVASAPSAAVSADAAAPALVVRLDTSLISGVRGVFSSSSSVPIGTWRLDGDSARVLIGGAQRSVSASNRVACAAVVP